LTGPLDGVDHLPLLMLPRVVVVELAAGMLLLQWMVVVMAVATTMIMGTFAPAWAGEEV